MLQIKGIPLYYQIETLIRNRIIAGEFNSGSSLPTEEALSEKYKVSRITIRRAMEGMVSDGLIVRQRGKGTFVAKKARHLDVSRMVGNFDDLIIAGTFSRANILDFSWMQPGEEIIKALQLEPKTSVLRIERMRSTRRGPFIHICSYSPPGVGEHINKDDLIRTPMLQVISENLGMKLVKRVDNIVANIADYYIADKLGIRVGQPVLTIESVTFNERNVPIDYCISHLPGDGYSYTVIRDRDGRNKFI
ncbi:MAG TPA: GntR family transcriptional regulator [Dehalococcoidia bacterium]|nr:GntR family transcriptional regulator [Dehalococcoidia bacterium]